MTNGEDNVNNHKKVNLWDPYHWTPMLPYFGLSAGIVGVLAVISRKPPKWRR